MTAIGVYEAKTQLPKLLERVRRGERFVITRHGRPVGRIGADQG
jgi:prevent-host-death family protein